MSRKLSYQRLFSIIDILGNLSSFYSNWSWTKHWGQEANYFRLGWGGVRFIFNRDGEIRILVLKLFNVNYISYQKISCSVIWEGTTDMRLWPVFNISEFWQYSILESRTIFLLLKEKLMYVLCHMYILTSLLSQH